MFPSRIQLSKKTWDRLQYMQTKTRLTPNVLARTAIALALRDTHTATINENKPEQTHVINRDVLFGDQASVYEALIRQFCTEQKVDADVQDVVRSLIDIGLHKMGHIKKLLDLDAFFS
ncbi:DndE family protein [Halomonas sp. TG39a]|uniref:DndE family protein n=1 Tax=Halomonas sp. TG39a TaxID=1415755 RepID=UPI00055189B8|nr:DndE family protein [Halomonas sp. TG39a]|tara:strand:- start:10250 stop:10603 length:354 start_codon:yes stop_codon:yes gene_type:complete